MDADSAAARSVMIDAGGRASIIEIKLNREMAAAGEEVKGAFLGRAASQGERFAAFALFLHQGPFQA